MGSCAPLTPNININVSMSQEEMVKQRKRLASAKEFEKTINKVDSNKCKPLTKEEIERYKYPALPDLSKFGENDKEAIANALAEHVGELRGELGVLLTRFKCTQAQGE
jgi:hypothetical protein